MLFIVPWVYIINQPHGWYLRAISPIKVERLQPRCIRIRVVKIISGVYIWLVAAAKYKENADPALRGPTLGMLSSVA